MTGSHWRCPAVSLFHWHGAMPEKKRARWPTIVTSRLPSSPAACFCPSGSRPFPLDFLLWGPFGHAATQVKFKPPRSKSASQNSSPGLPALLAAPGRVQGRQALLLQSPPAGNQRGRTGRRAACSYVLLRNSFSGKWGSFTQQRPLALSSVRRLQRPPRNVTVRCQDALGYLRALPRQAPRQAIYADPPYIFPGRSMNYYGTRRRGHDLAFHSRRALRKRPALCSEHKRRA